MTRITRTVLAVAAVAIVAVVGCLSTATTTALWNSSAPIAPVTVTTGTAGLAVGVTGTAPSTAPLALPATFATDFLPGDRHTVGLTIANTGSAPLVVSATATGLPSETTLQVSTTACATQPTPDPVRLPNGATTGLLTLPVGSADVCLSLDLSPAAPASLQGTQLSAALALTLTGTTTPDAH